MTKKGKPVVCVDFDGVLNTYEGWKGEDGLYEPRIGAKEFLQVLSEEYIVVILSTRSWWKIKEWLEKYNLSQYVYNITDHKYGAVAYIDDRSIRFDGNYHKVLHELRNFKTHWEKKYYDGYTNPDWDEDDGLRFHLAYESKEGWWAVNDSGVTLWKEEVIYELNELNNQNEQLTQQNKELKEERKGFESCSHNWGLLYDEAKNKVEELSKENKELQERNNRQAKQLGNIYHLIEKQDWKTLKGIIEEFKECEEQLQKEWSTYGDV